MFVSALQPRVSSARVGEVNQIEVRCKVVSVVAPVEMIQIGFMKEGVAPTVRRRRY